MTRVVVSSGSTWTVPADCIAATVELIGAGQGGNATNGGNGGDYAGVSNLALTPGAVIPIQIGVGGLGVASGSQNAGGDTKFGTYVLAKGGGSASADIGSTTFAGGLGDASGGGGGAAGPNAAGGAASGSSGGQGDGTFGGLGGASGAAGAAGAEWGTVGSGGGGGSAAAVGPAFVQGNINAPSGPQTVASVTLPVKATSGNILIAAIECMTTAAPTTPTGWTLDQSANLRNPSLHLFHKTSDGTETGISVTLGASAAAAACITEWSGAAAGASTSGTSPAASSVTFNSPSAPSFASSVPLVFLTATGNQTGMTISPLTWTVNAKANGYPTTLAYAYAAAPNASVSSTATWSSSVQSNWAFIWVDP